MNLTFVDKALWSVSLIGQIVLFCVLIQRRLHRLFPVFTAYILYCSVADLFVWFFMHRFSKDGYFVAYFANNAAEFLLQLGILLEVGWNVLSPVKRSLPKSSSLLLVVLGAGGTLAVFFLSIYSSPQMLSRLGDIFVRVNYTFAYLRLVVFSAIVFFSQMLGIGWKNHVLQITTGFAGYSIVILMVEVSHRFVGMAPEQYHLLEQVRIAGWWMALGYWIVAFAKKEAPRKEFSPKMAGFLISIAGTAREGRESATRLTRK